MNQNYTAKLLDNYATYGDEQLLLLMKENSAAAFSEIYERNWKKLFSLAANKLNNHHLAEDIVQDVFIDLWKRRTDIKLSGSLIAYLFSATRYKIIDSRLQQARRKNRELSAQEITPGTSGELDRLVDFHLLQEHLQKLMFILPQKTQVVYRLSKDQGYSHRQIAAHLNVSEKTVEYHLTKVMKHLRTGLGHFFIFLLLA